MRIRNDQPDHALLAVMAFMLLSCSDPGVRVYDIPKEPVADNPFAAPSAPPAAAASTGQPTGSLRWELPEAWSPAVERPMRLASYQAAEGAVDISVVRLGGDAGGLAANVNRWRGQVGLGPESEEQISRAAGRVALPGLELTTVELIGPESATLAGIVPHAGESWFFKMTGPKDKVAAEAERFHAWVKSIRLAGGDGKEAGGGSGP